MVTDTKSKILDAAQRRVQTHGYAGFSFHDLKEEVGISTASIHYHFPTKADLGVALVRRFRDMIRIAMHRLAVSQPSFPEQMGGVIALYESVRAQNCICLGSALGGEYGALPSEVRTELRAFVEDTVTGLIRLIESGQKLGEVRTDIDALSLAQTWYATLQGSLTASRASDPVFLARTTQTLLKLSMAA